MQVDELIDRLDYRDNPNYICGDDLGRAADYAHIFRRARSRMELHGVYVLQQPASRDSHRNVLVPVVYLCEAENEKEAREFRRLTWNQNAAPFVIIKTPANVRVFSSFNYSRFADGTAPRGTSKNVLDRCVEFHDIASILRAFASKSIDDGTIWRDYGQFVTPKGRVDSSLLKNLEKLDEVLIGSGLEWRTSHALIGKYVYLWYLRQRDILSNRRLDGWKIDWRDVFTGKATLSAFRRVLEELENWLNGSVFPLEWERASAPRQEHLRRVASVFAGDTLDGQLHLPFDAYDFSIIPVETLSAIYELFLHANEPKENQPRGKELGAYYTPVPVVNFMLEELNDRYPLKEGMTCFDASCGSGAFLVQCYRRLIENRVRKDGNAIRRPAELRDLLVEHIFGMDRDGDACRVTELSLILTLLDYVNPADLSSVPNFKLPDLHDKNIFEADFFAPDSTWAKSSHKRCYHWVVGNPPWVELKPLKKSKPEGNTDKNRHVRDWINDPANKGEMPVGGNQLAEAFLWKITQHLEPRGVAAMLVPAMTLFKEESTDFRQRFFRSQDVWCVANFANLAYVLFAGRAETPAAALFYSARMKGKRAGLDHTILCYSPLVATQEANRPERAGSKKDTWTIIVNSSEIREISVDEASSGDALVWKIAMWGSHLDLRLLKSVTNRFDTIEVACRRLGIKMHEGFQLRETIQSGNDPETHTDTSLKFVKELIGKKEINSSKISRCGRIYAFPKGALLEITENRAFLRVHGGELGLDVSKPPHIILDPARRFAVYSEDFIAVPQRYIGIAGEGRNDVRNVLKMISLYLVSDFALYHQFLRSPQMGTYKSIADLNTLKQLPFPLEEMTHGGLEQWSQLHRDLAAASTHAKTRRTKTMSTPSLFGEDESDGDVSRLERQFNTMVNDALGLRPSDRWLIRDLVHTRMTLTKGKVDPLAVGAPSPEKDIRPYCEVLKEGLDSLVEVVTDDRYLVDVIHEKDSAMIMVHRAPARPPDESIRILPANAGEAQSLRQIRQDLLQRHSQWLYFERAMRRYRKETGEIYLFKPMQRLYWLRSQALIDAGEVIADLAGGGEE